MVKFIVSSELLADVQRANAEPQRCGQYCLRFNISDYLFSARPLTFHWYLSLARHNCLFIGIAP